MLSRAKNVIYSFVYDSIDFPSILLNKTLTAVKLCTAAALPDITNFVKFVATSNDRIY